MQSRASTAFGAAAVAVVAALGFGTAACTDDGSDLDDAQAAAIADAGASTADARAFLDEPDDVELLFLADPDEAAAVVEAAAGDDPDDPEAAVALRQVLHGLGDADALDPGLARMIAAQAAPHWSELLPVGEATAAPDDLTTGQLGAAFDLLTDDEEAAALTVVGLHDAAVATAKPTPGTPGTPVTPVTIDSLDAGMAQVVAAYEALAGADTDVDLDALVARSFDADGPAFATDDDGVTGAVAARADEIRDGLDDAQASAYASAPTILEMLLFTTIVDNGLVPDLPTVPEAFRGTDGTIDIPRALTPEHNDFVGWINSSQEATTASSPDEIARTTAVMDRARAMTEGLRGAFA